MALSRSIKGLTTLITGAASGMGLATARLFAQEGANVAITDLRQEACNEAAEAITNSGAKGIVLPLALDVGDRGVIKKTIDQIADHFGSLDIIVNNAGLSTLADISDDQQYEQAWATSLDVLLSAHQRLIRAALPYLKKSSCPRIVNIASTEGLGATPGNSPYAVAKHGVIGLTRALAVDLGREGITVNCICPGPIHTGITQNIPDEHKKNSRAVERLWDDMASPKKWRISPYRSSCPLPAISPALSSPSMAASQLKMLSASARFAA